MEWTVSDKEWPKYLPLILDQYKGTVKHGGGIWGL